MCRVRARVYARCGERAPLCPRAWPLLVPVHLVRARLTTSPAARLLTPATGWTGMSKSLSRMKPSLRRGFPGDQCAFLLSCVYPPRLFPEDCVHSLLSFKLAACAQPARAKNRAFAPKANLSTLRISQIIHDPCPVSYAVINLKKSKQQTKK